MINPIIYAGAKVRAWIHFGYSTDEVRSHQLGAVCGERVSVSRFKEIIPIIFHTQNGVQPRFCNPAQQVQALAATVEELTRQNQEMKLRLQQEENRSKGSPEDEGNSQRRSDRQRPVSPDDQNSNLLREMRKEMDKLRSVIKEKTE